MPNTLSSPGIASRYQILLLALLCCALAACQASPPSPAPEPALPALPALPDAPRYAVDPSASELRVLVRRAGPLSRFGHDHVIVAPVTGVIHAGDSAAHSGFQLTVNVEEFAVDPPQARADEGEPFMAPVSQAARKDTRANLLSAQVLDAQRHPHIEIRSVAMRGPRWNPQVTARVTLRGAARDIAFPAAVFVTADKLVVIASFTIVQSEFGIEPFAVLGGGLAVRDALDARVRIVAHPEDAQ